MRKKYWILTLVSVLLIVGCVLSDIMSLIVSIVAIVFYALIMGLFVFPSFQKPSTEINVRNKH